MTAQEQLTAGESIPPPEAREELERVLNGPAFRAAPRLSRFLRFISERALAGDAEGLKEYVIGLEVFDRDKSFDPRIDTIVRVQARRLRLRLEEHYRTEGGGSALRIELPKGGYAPAFRAAPPAPHAASPGLPAPRTSFVGRELELRQLTALLVRKDVRLTTATGPGGIGKTRLALETAFRLAFAFPGGIRLVELAAVAGPSGVAALVAQAYRMGHAREMSLEEALCERLRAVVTRPALLVLDNFEHLTEAASLVSKLLDACAPLTVLVTSRRLLRLYGEHEFPVPPLETRDPDGDRIARASAPTAAMRLFEQRAKAVSPDFELTRADVQDVADICYRLDGVPLAIELAAARAKAHPPAVLLDKLSRPLEVLTAGPRDAPRRQQTLRATIEWSCRLLREDELKLFRRLAVFVGGGSLEAVEAVGNAPEDIDDVEAVVESLAEQSLVRIDALADGSRRVSMLETIREFALQLLEQSGEDERVRRAHAAWVLVSAEERGLYRKENEREDWLARCDRDYGNIESALDWMLQAGGVNWFARTAVALFDYWEARERLEDGRRRLETARALPGLTPKLRAAATGFAGAVVGTQGDTELALKRHTRALEMFREIGAKRDAARELNSMAVALRFSDRLDQSRELFLECLEACRELGDRIQIAAALSNLAGVTAEQGQLEEAEKFLGEAQEIFGEIGDLSGLAWSANHLADQSRARKDFGLSRKRYAEALELFRKIRDPWGVGRTLHDMAELAAATGDDAEAHGLLLEALSVFTTLPHHRGVAGVLDSLARLQAHHSRGETALQLAGAAATVRETLGGRPAPWRSADRNKLDDALAGVRRAAGETAAQAAWDRGRAMSLDDAVSFARSLARND